MITKIFLPSPIFRIVIIPSDIVSLEGLKYFRIHEETVLQTTIHRCYTDGIRPDYASGKPVDRPLLSDRNIRR